MNQTLILTYNRVQGFNPGSHGNGRVVIHQIDKESFTEENCAKATAKLRAQVSVSNPLETEAYVYLGLSGGEEQYCGSQRRVFKAATEIALALIRDHSRIHVIGCSCYGEQKKNFAEAAGFDYIQCKECGGHKTLGKIVEGILTTTTESHASTT